jgi:1-acyl-sn-glycerol-3-phosphate acyltransferase
MTQRFKVEERERLPRDGPLLLISNHPGLSDAVALFASTLRPDLRMVASEWPFLDALPNTSRYLFTVA